MVRAQQGGKIMTFFLDIIVSVSNLVILIAIVYILIKIVIILSKKK